MANARLKKAPNSGCSALHVVALLLLLISAVHCQAEEEDGGQSTTITAPLLLWLCSPLTLPPSSADQSSLSDDDHQMPSSSMHRRSQPAISRSLGLLSRPGQTAQLGLFNEAEGQGNNGTEWAKWLGPDSSAGELRCVLRLEACPECLIQMQWDSPRAHFTDFQIQSLASCEQPGTEDADMLLAADGNQQQDQGRPCFGLQLVEERADRPLPPNAESSSNSRALFAPTYVFRRASIWEVPEGAVRGTFKSTGNTLMLMATLRHVGQDAQIGRWLRRLFPLRINVLDNRILVFAQWNNNDSNNGSSSSDSAAIFAVQSARYPAAYPRGIRQNITIIRPAAVHDDQQQQRGVPRNEESAGTIEVIRLWFDDFRLHYISELKVLDAEGRELFNSRREHRRPPAMLSRSASLSILFWAREFTEPIGFRARFQLANADDPWADRPTSKNCDQQLDAFGGRISLDGQRHLLGEWLDCVWVLGRLQAGTPPLGQQQADQQLYLRVDQFHPKGQQMRLEVREGGFSTGRLLLELVGEQSAKQLVQKQPEEGFVAVGPQQGLEGGQQPLPPAFYLRLRGRLESLAGLSVVFAYFHRWPTALCPGGGEEFHCDNGKCIRATLRCDGFDHCGDSSDEMLCHFPPDGSRPSDDDSWPSSALTTAFGALVLFLLLLLLVLFTSRTARRHLVPVAAPLQSVRRRLRQQPTMGRHCCSASAAAHQHRAATATNAQATAARNSGGGGQQQQQRVQQAQQQQLGLGHAREQQQQTGSAGQGPNRRNSSSLATQLDFAVLNNLLGSAAVANLGPSIQTLGERRFFVLPADQAPISVIEAPPTYQDALKHPKVTPRGSHRLVHPSGNNEQRRPPSHQQQQSWLRRGSEGNNAVNAMNAVPTAYQNMAFRLSPTELLSRMEMEMADHQQRQRSSNSRAQNEQEHPLASAEPDGEGVHPVAAAASSMMSCPHPPSESPRDASCCCSPRSSSQSPCCLHQMESIELYEEIGGQGRAEEEQTEEGEELEEDECQCQQPGPSSSSQSAVIPPMAHQTSAPSEEDGTLGSRSDSSSSSSGTITERSHQSNAHCQTPRAETSNSSREVQQEGIIQSADEGRAQMEQHQTTTAAAVDEELESPKSSRSEGASGAATAKQQMPLRVRTPAANGGRRRSTVAGECHWQSS